VGASTLAVSIKKDRETGERETLRQASIALPPALLACTLVKLLQALFHASLGQSLSLLTLLLASCILSSSSVLLLAGFLRLSSLALFSYVALVNNNNFDR